MAKTKRQLEQDVLSLEKVVAVQRKQISVLVDQLEKSYDESQTVSRVDYDKLRDDNAYYKNQLQLVIESNKEELERERRRHDDLISFYEAQSSELAAFKNAANTLKPHNERNAGRRTKFDSIAIITALDLRASGKTYPEIADSMGLAVGTVYKIINS
jgi:hypothetical protein